MTPERRHRTLGLPWQAFFVAGAALVVLLPLVPWNRWVWATRILAFGPAGKALALAWKAGRAGGLLPAEWLLAALAAIVASLMAWAGWTAKPAGGDVSRRSAAPR